MRRSCMAVVLVLAVVVLDGYCGTERKTEILFDTGKGTGKYDRMTYYHYFAWITLMPKYDMTVVTVTPVVNYCNGNCFFTTDIIDRKGKTLASMSISGKRPADFANGGKLDKKITLKKGRIYLIRQHAWTTASIGIHTAGCWSLPKEIGTTVCKLISASSDTASHKDRGCVAFTLKGYRK